MLQALSKGFAMTEHHVIGLLRIIAAGCFLPSVSNRTPCARVAQYIELLAMHVHEDDLLTSGKLLMSIVHWA
jgi:hypothetical protein